jgi:hypothetical protein
MVLPDIGDFRFGHGHGVLRGRDRPLAANIGGIRSNRKLTMQLQLKNYRQAALGRTGFWRRAFILAL